MGELQRLGWAQILSAVLHTKFISLLDCFFARAHTHAQIHTLYARPDGNDKPCFCLKMKCCFISQQDTFKMYKYKSHIISKSRKILTCAVVVVALFVRHKMALRIGCGLFNWEDMVSTKNRTVRIDSTQLFNRNSDSWLSRQPLLRGVTAMSLSLTSDPWVGVRRPL